MRFGCIPSECRLNDTSQPRCIRVAAFAGKSMKQEIRKPGWNVLALFLGGVVLVGLLLGYANRPDGWRQLLRLLLFNGAPTVLQRSVSCRMRHG